MKREPADDLEREIRRLRGDRRQLSDDQAYRAKEVAALWLEIDVEKMFRDRGVLVPSGLVSAGESASAELR